MITKRICGSIVMLVLLCVPSLYAQEMLSGDGSGTQEAKLRFAATQHEIISILIEENQFSAVPAEFAKILELRLSDQKLIVQEAWIITEGLTKAQRFDIAHKIVDMTLGQVTDEEDRFALLMLKGKVYKQEGRAADAIAVFRRAQALRN